MRRPAFLTAPILCLTLASCGDAPELSAYEGLYPPDSSAGPPFLSHPLVVGGVERVVTRPDVRTRVLGGEEPQTPIWIEDGQVNSWGCEAHNCGSHNWTISMGLDGSEPEVCYHNDVEDSEGAIWFSEAGEEVRDLHCPSEAPES